MRIKHGLWVRAVAQAEKDGWDFFKLPGFADGKGDGGLLTGAPDGFMVSAKTQHPKEALEFLKFLTSADQGRKYVKVTGMTSAVKGSITAENADALARFAVRSDAPVTLRGIALTYLGPWASVVASASEEILRIVSFPESVT